MAIIKGNVTLTSVKTGIFRVHATLGAFIIPDHLYGDAPFTLTAPTSNSAGTWTYSSSDTTIATISGNTVTIVGTGSITITATQAQYDIYLSTSTSANMNVNSFLNGMYATDFSGNADHTTRTVDINASAGDTIVVFSVTDNANPSGYAYPTTIPATTGSFSTMQSLVTSYGFDHILMTKKVLPSDVTTISVTGKCIVAVLAGSPSLSSGTLSYPANSSHANLESGALGKSAVAFTTTVGYEGSLQVSSTGWTQDISSGTAGAFGAGAHTLSAPSVTVSISGATTSGGDAMGTFYIN